MMREALTEQFCAQRLLQALHMPGMCTDLGLQAPPSFIKPLTTTAYAKALRPM